LQDNWVFFLQVPVSKAVIEVPVLQELLPLLAPQQIPYEEKLARLPEETILPEIPLKMVHPGAGVLSR
jgi:hypothetical protein